MITFRDLRYLAYGVGLVLALWAFPAKAEFACTSLKQELPKLFTAGYAYLGAGALPDGSVIMMFIARNGDFKFIGVDEDQNSCEMIVGDSWSFIMVQGI